MPGYRCVEVSYYFDGRLTKRFINFKEDANTDYIKEAKKIIESDLKTKKLNKHSRRYHHNYKPLLIGLVAVFVGAATVSAAVLTSKYLLSKGEGGYKPTPVEPTEVGVTITNPDETKYRVELKPNTSTKAQDFKSEIELKTPPFINPDSDYFLPDTLDEVTVDGNQITNYTYSLDFDKGAKSASFFISGVLVTGKINITLTVQNEMPIQEFNIVASEECSGVTIPEGQKVAISATSGFGVKINPIDTEKEVLIEKIKFNNQEFIYPQDFFVEPSSTKNVYLISFVPETDPITTDVAITAKAVEPVKYRDMTIESDTLCFYNQEREPITGPLEFKPDVNFVTYIGTKEEVSSYLPLGLNITGTTNNEERQLILGKDYQYRFIDDKFAELTIFPGSGDILIGESDPDTSAASFIYHVDANSPAASITFEFNNTTSASAVDINWGDTTELETVTGTANTPYSISHTFETSEIEHDYLISFNANSTISTLPNEFGFNVYDDQVGINIDHRFSPSEEIAPYCSGISNITAIKMNGNSWAKFIEEGLIHTNIESLYIPKNMQVDGRYLSYCDNLSYFYLGAESNYEISEDRKMLLQKVSNSYTVVAILGESSEEGIVLDTFNDLPITTIRPYACVGRSTITSLTLGKDVDEYLYGAIIDCSNLNEINVDDTNTTYITNEDIGGNAVNMIAKQKNNEYEVETLLLAIKNTLPDGEEFTAPIDNIESFAFSGTNTPEEFIMEKDMGMTELNPYSFYHASNLRQFEVGNLYLPHGDISCDPVFYGCSNLESISIYQKFDLTAGKCPTMGVIQKCPKLQIEIREEQSTDVNTCIYVYNNAIYYLDTSHNATLIGTTYNSSIVNSFNVGNNTYIIKKFVNCAFNGNNVSEIYIPSEYDVQGSSVYPFVGCDGAMFNCNCTDGFAETKVDVEGNPIQSIFYIKDNNEKFVLTGTSLLNNNKNLTIPSSIDIIGSYSISGSSVEKIIFEGEEEAVDEFSDYAIFNCHNLTSLDFSKLSATEADDIPTLSPTHAIEDNDYYLTHIIVFVKNSSVVDLFKADSMWTRFTNIVSVE